MLFKYFKEGSNFKIFLLSLVQMEKELYVQRYLEKLNESVGQGEVVDAVNCSGLGFLLVFSSFSQLVKELLALVFVTSAVPSNPSTDLISEVVGSYLSKEPVLEQCEKIIVCDAPVSLWRVGGVCF